jgi:hypothetical protein
MPTPMLMFKLLEAQHSDSGIQPLLPSRVNNHPCQYHCIC